MKRLILLAVIVTQSWGFNAHAIDNQPSSQTPVLHFPAIIRVYYAEPNQIQKLVDNTDVWSINQTQNFAVVYLPDNQAFKLVQASGLPISLDTQRMEAHANDLLKLQQHNQSGTGIPGFSCYSTVAETWQRIDTMVANFPSLASSVDIGDSWEKIQNGASGEDLRVIKLTNQNRQADKPILFMASSIHAREYATAELNTRFAEYLLNNYGTDADVTWILDNHEIHLSLMTNPDGRKQAQTGILWRKNTNNNHCPNSNSRGVDLNRNYPFEWAIGGSGSACSEVYYGPSEGSEPEISAQMDYLREIYEDNRGTGANDAAADDTAGIFVDIHSYSQLVLWPWGYTNNVTANDNQLQALGKRTALFNQYRPQPVNDLVITGGGSIDAAYGELGVASLAFELGTAFFQDCESFENQILPDNLQALLYLARVTQAPYTQALGPDVENLLVIPNVVAENTAVQVSGVADDDRYNQSNGIQAVNTVEGVNAFINVLPINSNAGEAMMPADGAFNSSREAFTGSLSTNGLPAGKNLLYVQAFDNTQGGATFAQFIDVVDPQDVATLSGTVHTALTGEQIEGALLSINQSQALSDENGTYLQYVQPSVADLVVQASGFVDLTIIDLNLNAGDQQTQDIELQPYCELFSDDVELGNVGWQAEAPWAISSDQSSSPTHAWTDSPGVQYNNNLNISLTSPSTSVTGASTIEISYMSYCDTEAGYDFGHFEVRYDNDPWLEISQCDNQNTWQKQTHQLNLPANTDNLALRFRLTTDGSVISDGWHLDDLSVKASGAVCQSFYNDLIFADDFD